MTLPYLIASILAVLGQLGDCVTTQIALSLGGQEANPLMVWVVRHVWIQYSLKLGLALLCVVVSQKLFAHRRFGMTLLLVCAAGGFIPAIFNLAVISRLLR